MTRVRAIALFALCGIGVIGCNNDNNVIGPLPRGLVVAFKNDSFDFTTLRTFALPDTVVQVKAATSIPFPVATSFNVDVLDRVRLRLLSRGFVEVADPQAVKPDFVVLVMTTQADRYDAWRGYSWFADWGFYAGWGWYTPGFTNDWSVAYPWFRRIGSTAYNRGTIIVDLIPMSSVNAESRTLTSAWGGVATAILGGPTTTHDVTAAIDEMFTKSPYLRSPEP